MRIVELSTGRSTSAPITFLLVD